MNEYIKKFVTRVIYCMALISTLLIGLANSNLGGDVILYSISLTGLIYGMELVIRKGTNLIGKKEEGDG
ncbi:hypothetical protein [Lactococcus petauri]|uniref:hypothetical protein n=1 Tax=Lactococcus petauri TaxID=1940789 RepID=UPI00254F3385|nr:hypothetical protein [Lactococcus petauri]